MTDSPKGSSKPTDVPAGKERRRHHHLRDLVDEMMASIRAAANRDIFTTEDRAEAEAQLARIMQRVHAEALSVAERARGTVGTRAD